MKPCSIPFSVRCSIRPLLRAVDPPVECIHAGWAVRDILTVVLCWMEYTSWWETMFFVFVPLFQISCRCTHTRWFRYFCCILHCCLQGCQFQERCHIKICLKDSTTIADDNSTPRFVALCIAAWSQRCSKILEKLCSGRASERYGVKMLWKTGSLKRVGNLCWLVLHLRKKCAALETR